MYPNPADVLAFPPRPHLEQYKKRAQALVTACKSGERDAIRTWAADWIESLASALTTSDGDLRARFDQRVNQIEDFAWKTLSASDRRTAICTLADAQFVIARVHGFKSWPHCARHINALTRTTSPISRFESAVEAVITGDMAALRRLLRASPALIRARSPRDHQATLLQYVAANGVEGFRQKTPENAVDVAKLLLGAGADVDAPNWPDGPAGPGTTLGEVATSAHPARAGVQIPLMQTLLDYGANIDGLPSGWNPLLAALHNGRREAAEFLAARGARLDLEGAAGVGRLDVVQTFFNRDGTLRNATNAQMESGFEWACEYGRNDVVEFFLDRGADLRAGEKTNQTGLHWAVIGGELETVNLLLKRGAPLEATNVYGGTVLGQATWCVINGDRSIDYVPIIRALLAAGARIEEADYPTGNKRVDDLLRPVRGHDVR
jgi:ankyrin repeat protein